MPEKKASLEVLETRFEQRTLTKLSFCKSRSKTCARIVDRKVFDPLAGVVFDGGGRG